MSKAINGNTVRVHYKGTLEDGTVFDSSHERGETLDFELGTEAMLPGFQTKIVGMEVGETKSFVLTATEAYGEPVAEAVIPVPKAAFPEDFEFEVGTEVQGTSPAGEMVRATITEVEDETVLLDHNHPLSGKDLNFEVELVEIQEVTTDTE